MSYVDVKGDSVDGEGSMRRVIVYVDDAISEYSDVSVAISSDVAAYSDAAVRDDCGDASMNSSMSDGVNAAYVVTSALPFRGFARLVSGMRGPYISEKHSEMNVSV